MAALRARVAAQEDEIVALRAEIVAAERRDLGGSDDLARQLAAKERQISQLLDERAGLAEEDARLRRTIEEAGRDRDVQTGRITELVRASAEAVALIDTLCAERTIRDELIAGLKQQTEELERERDLLRGRIATYKQSGIAHLNELFQLCTELARRSVPSDHQPRQAKAEITPPASPAEGEPSELFAHRGR
jgi:chromosome segregation ATPase